MIHFMSITIHEKGKGDDYRAFLNFADRETMTAYEIRGYGNTPGAAADDAYARYDSEDRYYHVTDEWEWE
jgi:hypothetical protein